VALELEPVARELARWLRAVPGVTEISGPIMSPKTSKPRGPMPKLPKPSFLGGSPDPSFELRFIYKNQRRVFRYFVDQPDTPEAMVSNLRVHSNGELMVRVPNEFGQLMPNEIYYVNRSAGVTTPGRG
jgi:hypothetical protein